MKLFHDKTKSNEAKLKSEKLGLNHNRQFKNKVKALMSNFKRE